MKKFMSKIRALTLLGVSGVLGLSAASGFKGSEVKASEDKITYVSLGDSMTTGYGFNDYYVDDDPIAQVEGVDYKLDDAGHKSVRGFLQKASESYAGVMSDTIGEIFGEENVNWIQLAANAMRIDDIYYALSGDKNVDKYYEAQFDATNTKGSRWNKIFGERAKDLGYTTLEGNEAVHETYENAVKSADLITLNAGFSNFSCSILWKLGSFVDGAGIDSKSLNMEDAGNDTLQEFFDRHGFEVTVDQVFEEIYTLVEGFTGLDLREFEEIEIGGYKLHVRTILETVALSFVSYTYYMNETTKLIKALNPDARLAVVGMTNPIKEANMKVNGKEIPVGELFQALIEIVNTYLAVGTEEKDNYVFIDATELKVRTHLSDLSYNALSRDLEERAIEGVEKIMQLLNILYPGEKLKTTPEEFFSEKPVYNPMTAIGRVVYIYMVSAANREFIDVNDMMESLDEVFNGKIDIYDDNFDGEKFESLLLVYIETVLNGGMWSHLNKNTHIALGELIFKELLTNRTEEEKIGLRIIGILKTAKNLALGFNPDIFDNVPESVMEVIELLVNLDDEEITESLLIQLGHSLDISTDYMGILETFPIVMAIVDDEKTLAYLETVYMYMSKFSKYFIHNSTMIVDYFEDGTCVIYKYCKECGKISDEDWGTYEIEWTDDENGIRCHGYAEFDSGLVFDEYGFLLKFDTKYATLDECGETQCYAYFMYFEDQSYTAETAKLSIVSTQYVWDENNRACVALMDLSDGTKLEEVGQVTYEVTKEPKPGEDGVATWTAVFAHAASTTVTKAIDKLPEEPIPVKTGCGGSIVTASAIISLIAIAGCALLLARKREEN